MVRIPKEVTRLMPPEHLPPHTVADHHEGLLGSSEAAAADRHLATCAECASIRDGIAQIRTALAAEAPERMPAWVAARIDVALAITAAERGSQELVRAAAAGRSGDVAEPAAIAAARPTSPPGRRRRWRPALGTALAAILVTIGAAAIYPQLRADDQNDSTAAGGAPALTDQTPTQDSGGAGEGNEDANSGSVPAATAAGLPPVVSSGRQYTAYTLSAGVSGLLAATRTDSSLNPLSAAEEPAPRTDGEASGGPSPGSGSRDRESLPAQLSALYGRLSQPAVLEACIHSITAQGAVPIVVDIAFYSGKPAAIIVVPDPADATNAFVYVVSESCGRGSSTTTLAQTTVRRPVTPSPSLTPSSSAPSSPAPSSPAAEPSGTTTP